MSNINQLTQLLQKPKKVRKRPMTEPPFVLYCQERLPELIQIYGTSLHNDALLRLLNVEWNAFPDDEKAKYQQTGKALIDNKRAKVLDTPTPPMLQNPGTYPIQHLQNYRPLFPVRLQNHQKPRGSMKPEFSIPKVLQSKKEKEIEILRNLNIPSLLIEQNLEPVKNYEYLDGSVTMVQNPMSILQNHENYENSKIGIQNPLMTSNLETEDGFSRESRISEISISETSSEYSTTPEYENYTDICLDEMAEDFFKYKNSESNGVQPNPSCPAPSKRPSNGFQIWLGERKRKQNEMGRKSATGQQRAGAEWKELPEETRRHYNDRAAVLRKQWKEAHGSQALTAPAPQKTSQTYPDIMTSSEFSEYFKTPDPIPPKIQKTSKLNASIPKRPLNAFNLFVVKWKQENMEKCRNMIYKEYSLLFSQAWKAMTNEEKVPFYVESKRLLDEFKEKYPDAMRNSRKDNKKIMEHEICEIEICERKPKLKEPFWEFDYLNFSVDLEIIEPTIGLPTNCSLQNFWF